MMSAIAIGLVFFYPREGPSPLKIKFIIAEILFWSLALYELIQLPKFFTKRAWVIALDKRELSINFRFLKSKYQNASDFTVLTISHEEIANFHKRRAKFQNPRGVKYYVTFLVITLKENLSQRYKQIILAENAHVKSSIFSNNVPPLLLGRDERELYIIWRHGIPVLMPSIGAVLKKMEPIFDIKAPVYEILKRIEDDPKIFAPPLKEEKTEVVIR